MMGSNFTTFKTGVIFGFGLTIPISVLVLVYLGLNSLTDEQQEYFIDDPVVPAVETKNKIGIEIVDFRELKNGNYTYIVGAYKNISNAMVDSFTIEAEFFDKEGNFVWLEHENIYKNIEPNETYNFAIKCGCQDQTMPEYSKVVVNAVK